MLDLSISPGTGGLAILKKVTPQHWLEQPKGDFSAFRLHGTIPLVWKSDRLALHEYDKNAQYLGAALGVRLGVGVPEYHKAPQFREVPGVWHISLEDKQDELLPPIVRKPDDSWEYTPILQLLKSVGIGFHIYEAYLFSEQHQALRPFAERMRTLRAQALDKPDELRYVKQLYTVTFGLLAHQKEDARPGYIYRPDWYYTLVAEAKARLFYQLLKVYQKEDVPPSAVQTDALYYPQCVQLPLGPGIGQFKHLVL